MSGFHAPTASPPCTGRGIQRVSLRLVPYEVFRSPLSGWCQGYQGPSGEEQCSIWQLWHLRFLQMDAEMTIETVSVSKFWSSTSTLLSLCMHSLVGTGLRADVGPFSSTLFICATLLGVGGIRPHLVIL